MAKIQIELFMLAYNRYEYTDMTLLSLRRVPSGVPWNHVKFTVIDQGSTDATPEVLAACSMIDRVVTLKKNLGCPGGMEYYRKRLMGSAPFVGKIDNDSLFTPRWLAKLHNALCACPQLGLVGAAQNSERHTKQLITVGGSGYYNAKFIGGRFLARHEIFQAGPIRTTQGVLYGWQPYQAKVRQSWDIGWCYPPAVIEHVGDWNMKHPDAITNDEYKKYMREVGRGKHVPA